MAILIDVLLLLILVICAFIGYKHGLVRTLSKFLSYIIAFTLANKFYYLLASLIARIPLFEEMISGEPYAESMTFMDRISYSVELIRENAIFGSKESMEAAKVIVDEAVAVIITSALAVIVSFFASLLLLNLLFFILEGVMAKIPVVKQINGVLGGVFGLLNGFFWTWVVTNTFVRFLLPTLVEKFPSVFVSEIADSLVVQFCTTINPITYLIWLINFIFH